MGKALLFVVLGASVVLLKQLANAHEAGLRTTEDQREYQESVLAREIAASAFNVGMGEIRSYGNRLRDGVTQFNGTTGAGRSGTITGGKYAGGRYEVRAQQTSGHSVRVTATGYYGRYLDRTGAEKWRSKVTMHDEYRVFVLNVRQPSIIDVNFIPGAAGYCSAVFYQAFRPEMPAGSRPAPVMLFTPANGNREGQHPAREIVVEPGTQMNFFIGVDQNCSTRPSSATTCQTLSYAQNYSFNFNDYTADGVRRVSRDDRFEYLHYALDVETGKLEQAKEAIWGMVEQHPDDPDRWRIGWEDIHDTSWNIPVTADPATHNPVRSLQATKQFGYDGRGWPQSDSRGYALTRDYGTRPDFEDQVIEIRALPLRSADGQDRVRRSVEAYYNCNLTPPQDLVKAFEETTTVGSASCRCQGNKKVAVMHRPPGNEANQHVICVNENGWLNGHRPQHNDYVVCRGL